MAAQVHENSTLFVNDNDESDEDDISLTSTVEEELDPDTEYVVANVLYERPEDGVIKYLIQWENYPMDQSTWEPVENLPEALQAQWIKQKEEISRGDRIPFDIDIYYEACAEATRRQSARHSRRNAKRRRLGIEPTSPLSDSFPEEEALSPPLESRDRSENSDEAMEQDEIDTGSPTKTQPPERFKQKLFKGIPLVETTASSSKVASAKSNETPSEPQDEASSGRVSPAGGYQGTARKPSVSDKVLGRPPAVVARPPLSRSSSSLASKFGKPKLTATRTRPIAKPLLSKPGSSSLRPKDRKKRINLKEAMMNPTKAPKRFNTMHRVNEARKRGQELNDAAPSDPSAIPAAFFIGDQPARNASAEQAVNYAGNETSLEKSRANSIQTPSAIAPPTGPKKERRGLSVRFTENVPLFDKLDEPMRIDSPIPPSTLEAPVGKTASVRKLSLDMYRNRGVAQDVEKSASFGAQGSRLIRVLFRGLPRTNQPWHSRFLAEDILDFRVVCTSDDFLSQIYIMDHLKISGGNLDSAADRAALETVAQNLRVTSSGLYLIRPEYSLLVYPNQCDTWAGLGIPDTPEFPLRYYMFQSSFGAEHFPPPRPESSASNMNSEDPTPASLCVEFMKRLSPVDYARLLPPKDKAGDPVFFLLFHHREERLFEIISLWLRSCESDCQILTSKMEGSWKRFLDLTRAGVVICHESTMQSIRKIPRLWDALQWSAHIFWCLSSSDQGLSAVDPNNGLPLRLEMTRLFPQGRVFLLTPSFVISEPARLCDFLLWFKERAEIAPCVLIACSDFPGYLRGLILEKANESHELRAANSGNPQLTKRENDDGLRSVDLEARIRALEIVNDMIATFQHGFDPDERIGEDIDKTVWAPDIIDQDDEQSLFSWFCWWTTTRLDSYRKFYVIGSAQDRVRAAHRMVVVPNYTPETVNDPDRVLARVATELEIQDNALTTSGEVTAQSVPYTSGSAILPGDRGDYFQDWIRDFIRSRGSSWSKLFRNPVAWVDVRMAERFGDQLCRQYDTYHSWLSSPSERFTQWSNTLLGLFYTIDTDWNPTSATVPTTRHPWIAIYRPVDAHHNRDSYAGMELLIWDCAATQRFPSNSPTEDRLLPMQRQLVDFVRREASSRFPEYYLDRVFVGGFMPAVDEPGLSAIDVTLKTLEAFMSMEAARLWLPPMERRLLERGWKRLMPASWVAPAKPTATGHPYSFLPKDENLPEFPKAPSDLGKPEKMIFHPGTGNLDKNRTVCTNDLYDAALEARTKDPNRVSFMYQYKPTMDWYQDLILEGRNCSYVRVGPWDVIFQDLHIGEDKQRKKERRERERREGPGSRDRAFSSSDWGSEVR